MQIGDLVSVTSPESLKKMDIVGLVVSHHGRYYDVYMPDICRSISFDQVQLEKIT
tara:strand:+ start:428 stop:592 length:165 start_codon:yes stop_codon:yes gene_type:complete